MSPVSRGFRHFRPASDKESGRVPPGQYVTTDFPVLSAGPTPHTPPEDWTFSITQGGTTLKSWSWQEMLALPSETITADIHCVTRWSKLGTEWQGVSVDTLLDQTEQDAPYVLAFCDGGYTTNLPTEDVSGRKAWVALRYNGEPLEPEHGGPARLLVPHLYFWKSAKWVRGLEVRDADEPGFWETLRLSHVWGPMAGTALHRRLTWQVATVTSVTRETASVVTIGLDPPDWPGHRAGQHLEVRLTADDGYQAGREYSIASAPGEPVAITVERLEGGEVSPYLTEELRAGDELELRGPVGGYFIWEPGDASPLMLLAGGSGIVPLRSILRHRSRTGSHVPTRLLYSSRTLPDVIYRDELNRPVQGVEVTCTLTRAQPPGWTGHTGRVDATLLAKVAWPAAPSPRAFICGPTSFVETAASGLVGLGYLPEHVKTERFGGTGGR